jgi:ubiquinone biosynthesis monooxygenase Coq7
MTARELDPLDRLLTAADNALRTLAADAPPGRPSPAEDGSARLADPAAQREAGRLMRVNHAGEVAAQALYLGQALVARDPATRATLLQAAAEEGDHLAWCSERLRALDTPRSRLTPFWYAGSFAIGALAGLAGDRWSLGFVIETERQVEQHIDGHLARLPEQDAASQRVLEQMKRDEVRHGDDARRAGGSDLPRPVRLAMRAVSKVMTETAYRF